MPKESRIKKSLLNARINLIFYILALFLSFFSRKMFLNYLGVHPVIHLVKPEEQTRFMRRGGTEQQSADCRSQGQ